MAEVENVRVLITKGVGYKGEVKCKHNMSNLGMVARTADPYLRPRKTYNAGHRGSVIGSWGGTPTNPDSYKVAVHDKTDIEYRKETVPFNVDEEFGIGVRQEFKSMRPIVQLFPWRLISYNVAA